MVTRTEETPLIITGEGLLMEDVMNTRNLSEAVIEFFEEYLDVVETSDSGREFHPIQISCVRCMKLKPLGNLMEEMKSLAYKERQEQQMQEWNL